MIWRVFWSTKLNRSRWPNYKCCGSGSGAFLTPGSGMGKKSRSGSVMNILDHISESNFFWVKILKFFDPGSGMEKKIWIRDLHPGSATLQNTVKKWRRLTSARLIWMLAWSLAARIRLLALHFLNKIGCLNTCYGCWHTNRLVLLLLWPVGYKEFDFFWQNGASQAVDGCQFNF